MVPTAILPKRMWILLPLAALLAMAVPILGMVVGESARVSSNDTHGSLEHLFGWSVTTGMMSCLGALPGTLLLLVPGKPRRVGVCLLVIGLAGFIGIQGGWMLSHPIRMEAFRNLADRSKPLIAAIQQFETKHGQAPTSLEALVPDYLPVVPTTGMSRYPNFRYLHGEEAQSFATNAWVLRVDCPVGALNWDMFLYFPNTNYPASGYGGGLERIGDWAYVHE